MDPPPKTGRPRFGKGRKAEDLEGTGLGVLPVEEKVILT